MKNIFKYITKIFIIFLFFYFFYMFFVMSNLNDDGIVKYINYFFKALTKKPIDYTGISDRSIRHILAYLNLFVWINLFYLI